MNKKRFALLFSSMAMSLALASCDVYSLLGIKTADGSGQVITVIGDEANDDPVASYTPSQSGMYTPEAAKFLPYNYRNLNITQSADIVPSSGNVKLLVLPIEFSDYSFSSGFLNDLNIVLNGRESDKTTGYWESLASFYKKSSFGKLNLSFEIAPVFQTTLTAQQACAQGDNAVSMVDLAVKNYKNSNETKHLDADENGFIDGVIAVYSCPNYSASSQIGAFDKDSYFWAYCYWNASAKSSLLSPNFNVYFWLSYDFIYNRFKQIDAHTMIHEFGHMMGLDDYYPNDKGASAFYPTGLLDMMDGNILDHDVFSKSVLGWTIPRVVDATKTVTLSPSQDSGDCILIPSGQWNGTAWSEYLLIELYTPTGLNQLDSTTPYDNRPLGYNMPGVKIFHIDARVVSGSTSDGRNFTYAYHNGTTLSPAHTSTFYRYYRVGASNCYKDENITQPGYSLIHLLESSGKVSFYGTNYAKNSSLFHQGDTFAMNKFSACFPRKTTLNCGAEFPYTIKVDAISNTSATLTITKA